MTHHFGLHLYLMFVFGSPEESLTEQVHHEDLQAVDLVQTYLSLLLTGIWGKPRWKTRERETCSKEGRWQLKSGEKKRSGAVIDSCLAHCLLRLFPPSTAIISRRTTPSPWQQLCHPSPLEDAIPFGRRWIGVPSPCMRSLRTESLQRGHRGVNRFCVNTSISRNTTSLSILLPVSVWLLTSFIVAQQQNKTKVEPLSVTTWLNS